MGELAQTPEALELARIERRKNWFPSHPEFPNRFKVICDGEVTHMWTSQMTASQTADRLSSQGHRVTIEGPKRG